MTEIRYVDAGVDRAGAAALVPRLRELAARSHGPEVLEGIGAFAGCFQLPKGGAADPVLVSSTDGVGTKVKVAAAVHRHRGIGIDLVNHCVNDVLTTGARPLFFLDYFASGRLEGAILEELVHGMSEACQGAGCALIGGETAEMPGVYGLGDYDVAGFLVGLVDRAQLLGPARVRAGDRLVGLPSSGLHTNGYTLVRHLCALREIPYDRILPGTDRPLSDLLLEPHRSYLPAVTALQAAVEVHAIAHITGGGILENLPRALPDDCAAVVDPAAWTVPPLFRALAELGPVPEEECWRTFNMGVGLICAVPAEGPLPAEVAGLPLWPLGVVVPRSGPDRVHLRAV